jgi:hypothetical protein
MRTCASEYSERRGWEIATWQDDFAPQPRSLEAAASSSICSLTSALVRARTIVDSLQAGEHPYLKRAMSRNCFDRDLRRYSLDWVEVRASCSSVSSCLSKK